MMGSNIVFILFAFLVEGVFGDAAEVKSVKEGDLVTLNTNVPKGKHDMVRWYFNDIRIALIDGDRSTSCLYDGEDGRFKDRLEVDYETGSLIIRDITTEHAGHYEAEFIKIDSSGQDEKLDKKPNCDSTKINSKFSILGDIIKSFSLTVSASKADKNEKEPKKAPQDHNIDATVPRSGLSSAAVVGIVVGVLLLAGAVVGVIYYRRWSSRNDIKKNKQVSNDKTQNDTMLMF